MKTFSLQGKVYLPELVFSIFETFSNVVNRLIFLVLVGLNRGASRFEGSEFRFITESVQ